MALATLPAASASPVSAIIDGPAPLIATPSAPASIAALRTRE
jgi:hypothetical protein